MASRRHDLLIIGGGICGASVAWDAALRGLDVALVEMGDFNHGTSSASSKLVHGGLRYLANGEFRLVRESLKERRIWERIAPHMVDPLPFLVPIYGGTKAGWIMRIGLTLYDILSLDRTWMKDPAKRLPRHRWLKPDEALKRAPSLTRENLAGALLYYDCQMYSPERLGLECILGAEAQGASIANYAKVTGFLKDDNRINGAVVEDTLTGKAYEVKATTTINASGPWADFVLDKAQDGKSTKHLLRSKGIHILTQEINGSTALALQAGGDHLFVLPWRGKTIIGTTDTAFRGKPDDVCVTESDIDEVIGKLSIALPNAHITRQDVLHTYAGLRPLIDTDGDPTNNDTQETYSASRKAEVVDHQVNDGLEGLISALGGKWTTSRHIAKRVVDTALKKDPVAAAKAAPVSTATTPTWCGDTGIYSDFVKRAIAASPGWDQDIIEHLAKLYGSRYDEVTKLAAETNLRANLTPNEPTIEAEVLYAVRNEMALTLSDVLLRRTELGTIGAPSQAALARMADLMASELGWSDAETSRQIDMALKRFQVENDGEDT
jgi:glycerol-3-phosphate dehydrogenase